MIYYIIKRILLIIPTLIGIMAINFLVIQIVPGGPVEDMMAKLSHITDTGAISRLTSGGGNETIETRFYRGASGIEEEIRLELTRLYGLDKPPLERFFIMLKQYFTFDFGTSFYRDRTVIELVIEKLPVSISLGLWTTLIIYLISIPIGILKAIRDGSRFDISTSTIIMVGYAIPNFLFAILLIIVFAGGEYFQWFPLRGLVSEDFAELSLGEKIIDYFHHLTLPVIAMTISGFAGLTLLTKNSFIDEIHKQYVTTARAKGLAEPQIIIQHVFRNAMLLIISSFPGALVALLFTSSLLIEVIFSLDGLGLLGFEATVRHDYPIMFGTLFFFSLLGLVLKLVSDLLYVLIDPRIDFEKRAG
ncbi:inner membrane ABC transporter permease protein YejB [Spirochaetota bacterium]|nr:inner membrane ABC transporter permease protein YejB [Spirochaetota bacterium]